MKRFDYKVTFPKESGRIEEYGKIRGDNHRHAGLKLMIKFPDCEKVMVIRNRQAASYNNQLKPLNEEKVAEATGKEMIKSAKEEITGLETSSPVDSFEAIERANTEVREAGTEVAAVSEPAVAVKKPRKPRTRKTVKETSEVKE
jgi:hypothetical protein